MSMREQINIKNFGQFINEDVSNIINKYLKDSEHNENSLNNCLFFTKDVINWATKNGIKSDYVYMPMSEEYRQKNKIGDDWEDHIVPMINGFIIDFTYTDSGVSHKVRSKNTIPPKVFKSDKSLFDTDGAYGKWGYTEPELNRAYGEAKNVNSFDEPKIK